VTAIVQLHGSLTHTPERRTTAVGKEMVTGMLIVELGRGEKVPEWFALVALGRISDALAKHQKGDTISVSGKLSKASWKTRDGEARSGFSVLLDGIASARTVGSSSERDELDEALAG
jgi:single-strand DNA-binding protein